MLFWIIIFLSTFVITLYSQGKVYSVRKRLYTILCVILIIMSSLRCGLGEDYIGYNEKIGYYTSLADISIYNEPIFVLLSYIINSTCLTPAVFFSIMAVITLGGIFRFYNRNENEYLSLTVLFFIFFPALFFNTFNIVRQFAAIGIFFYSLKFCEEKKFVKYFLCIFVSTLLHFSSIILLPLYFFLSRSFSKKSILLILVMGLSFSMLVSTVFSYMETVDLYTEYFDNGVEMGSSSIILLYNIMLLLCLTKRKAAKNTYDTIEFNLLVLLVIFSDLSYVNFYFYRLSLFFMPVAACMLPKSIGYIYGNKAAAISTILISFVLFLVFFIPNMNNPIVVRDELLPLSSFFDETIYKAYIH